MPNNEVSTLQVGGHNYLVKDAVARSAINNLEAVVGNTITDNTLDSDNDNNDANNNLIAKVNELRTLLTNLNTAVGGITNTSNNSSLASQVATLTTDVSDLSTTVGNGFGNTSLTNKINNLDTLFTKIGDLSSYNAVHSLVEQITQLDTDISTLATATGIDLTATNPTTPLGNAIGDLIQEVEELSEKIGTGINNSDLTAAIMQLQQLLGSWLDTAEQSTVIAKLESLITNFYNLYYAVGVNTEYRPTINARLLTLTNRIGAGIANSDLTTEIANLQAALVKQDQALTLLQQAVLLKNITDSLEWEAGTISDSDGADMESDENDIVLFSVEDPYVAHIDYLRTAAFPIDSWFKITPLNNYHYQIFLYSGNDINDLQFETIYYFSDAPYDIDSTNEIYNPFLTSNYTYCRLVTFSSSTEATTAVENINDYIQVFAPMTLEDINGN